MKFSSNVSDGWNTFIVSGLTAAVDGISHGRKEWLTVIAFVQE